jgi:hypothetical protein
VIVTILEVATSLLESPFNKNGMVNNFIEKLYADFLLFDSLIKNILEETGIVKVNINEFRLIARAFSLMPQHVYELLNPFVLNRPFPRQQQNLSASTIENYVKAVQIIVKTLSQSQAEMD